MMLESAVLPDNLYTLLIMAVPVACLAAGLAFARHGPRRGEIAPAAPAWTAVDAALAPARPGPTPPPHPPEIPRAWRT
jgi:hypothetical protein